ncbi:uncharacterized protein [Zea mays]|uniref:uncharacterized protein isoform X1 n=1 Tax=Zea mays TaxID=4577 RepID=UPI001652B6E5|nr:uncharacterized protein LOC103650772 isoform X1 [Zea mays]
MHVESGWDSADLRPISWPSFTIVVHDSAVLMLWPKGVHVVATFYHRGVHELVQPLSARVTDGQRYRPMKVDGAPKWMVIQYHGAATCLPGVQPSVSTGAVVELLLLSAASAAMVGMKIVDVGIDSGANRVQLAGKLKISKTDQFDSDAYVQSKCCAMDEKEVRHLCSYLQDLKKTSAEVMRRSVRANYVVFIKTSKEISDLEGKLLSVRNLPSTQSALIHGLSEGVQIDSLVTGPEGSVEQDISGAEDQKPSKIWKWSTEFPNMPDVLLAERRVDEALDRSLAVSTIIFANFHASIVWGYSGRVVPYHWFKSMFGWTYLKIGVDQLVRQCPVFEQTQEEQQFPVGSLHPSYLSGYCFNSLYRYASETNRLGATDRDGVLVDAYAL